MEQVNEKIARLKKLLKNPNVWFSLVGQVFLQRVEFRISKCRRTLQPEIQISAGNDHQP